MPKTRNSDSARLRAAPPQASFFCLKSFYLKLCCVTILELEKQWPLGALQRQKLSARNFVRTKSVSVLSVVFLWRRVCNQPPDKVRYGSLVAAGGCSGHKIRSPKILPAIWQFYQVTFVDKSLRN